MRNAELVPIRQRVRLGTTSRLPYSSLTPAPTISALQHLHKMRGGAQSQLFLGSDSRCWVVKFQDNPQHLRILANEWIVSSLARTIGLSVPVTGIVNVSPWLIENSPGLVLRGPEGMVAPTCGRQFGSMYAGGLMPGLVWDYLPESGLREVVNLQEFAGIFLLDKWTGNCDNRQAVFVRDSRAKRYKAVFIDFGHCFNAGSWTFPDLPMAGAYSQKVVYDHVTGWKCFEPWLSLIQSITPQRLEECKEGLPEEWYDGKVDILDRLIQKLYDRRNLIEMLIHQYRMSASHPFPKWRSIRTLPRNDFGNVSVFPRPPQITHQAIVP